MPPDGELQDRAPPGRVGSNSYPPIARRQLGRLSLGWAMVMHIVVLAGVLAAVWVPELLHWHVRSAALSDAGLAAAMTTPDQSRLQEIGSLQLRGVTVNSADLPAAATAVSRGVLRLPGFPETPIGLPFDPSDLERGSPTWGLMFASLAAADLLIDGFLATGREDWFDLAEQMVLAFARHEASRWLDQGLLWNDHATSARIPVLVKFWSIYRTRKTVNPETARVVLRLVARSARLLARPDAYAWRSSHGILADLALLQVAAAFPFLPEAKLARDTARSRFGSHLRYWINAEGVTLLHSAGYHSGSLYHLSAGFRLFTLNGLEIAPDWWNRFDRALTFEALLRRPDGSLPLLGDTMNLTSATPPWVTAKGQQGQAEALRPLSTPAVADANALLPGSGYALWRDSGTSSSTLSQTVMTWAYYPGLGHKLADELSVLVWSHGRTWITNVGYWPYGAWGREQAESWAGSNAPHLVDESTHSPRNSRALSHGEGAGVRFVEVERQGPDSFHVRRQLVRVAAADAWLVIDQGGDATPRQSQVAWTFAPGLELQASAGGRAFVAADSGDNTAMAASFAGSDNIAPELRKGSRAPFMGWVVVERTPTPAISLQVKRQSQGAWSMASFALMARTAAAAAAPVEMNRWRDAEHWLATLVTGRGLLSIERDGNLLRLGGIMAQDIALQPAATGQAEREVVQAAYAQAERDHRKFPEVVAYRMKITQLLLIAFAAQAVALLLLQLKAPRLVARMHVALWLLWSGGGLWLHAVYFA
jgi:Heparinase II/III-like protein/Heparinase II/III N-terminus